MTYSLSIDTFERRCARASALQECVGYGRTWSVEALAFATNLRPTTIKAARNDGTGSVDVWDILEETIGPEFTNRRLASLGMGGAAWLGKPVCGRTLNIATTRYSARFAVDDADGRVDRVEDAKQEPIVIDLLTASSGWLMRRRRLVA